MTEQIETHAPPEGYALALEEARRALDEQERAVVGLSARAGTLIGSAAITTSFFGGLVLKNHDLDAVTWVAIGAFVALGISMLLVIWPWRRWEFSVGPARFIATYLEPADGAPLTLPLIQRDLALHMGMSAELNNTQLRILAIVFRTGGILLMIEVVAWVVAIADGA